MKLINNRLLKRLSVDLKDSQRPFDMLDDGRNHSNLKSLIKHGEIHNIVTQLIIKYFLPDNITFLKLNFTPYSVGFMVKMIIYSESTVQNLSKTYSI